MRAILGLSAVKAILLAFLMASSSLSFFDAFALFFPIIILATLAIRLPNRDFRRGILLLEVAYSAIAATIIWQAFFGGEHDAGYQIVLLLIPVAGLAAVLVAGAAAFWMRRHSGSAKRRG